MATAPGPPNIQNPPDPPAFDWNAPQVQSLPIAPPPHGGYPTNKPLPLHRLCFNPLGAYDLRRILGVFGNEPLIWNTYRRRFLAADIAWLASGSSNDNQHYPAQDPGFFPDFDTLRDSLPSDERGYTARRNFADAARKIMFDIATILDRTLGSTTMILHSEGTTRPNTPVRPEYLSTTVYIPPSFLRQNPDAHMDIARLVQTHIEVIGTRTVLGWTANARHRNWSLTQSGPARSANYIPADLVIPAPKEGGSAVYVFRGRPAGSLAAPVSLSPPAAPVPPVPTSSQASTRYGSEEPEQFSTDALNLIAAIEHNHDLRRELDDLTSHVAALEDALTASQAQADDFSHQLGLAYAREDENNVTQRKLEMTISRLEHELGTHAQGIASSSARSLGSPRPPTYSPSQLVTPTKTRPIIAARSLDTVNPVNPWSPRSTSPVKGDLALPLTTACLTDNTSISHLPAIRLMIKHVASPKWHEELEGLGLAAELVRALLESLTRDLDL
ncbi:hypothetical protein B0H11DRAFT_2187601 [Mycena galericulata]|nr:hypothetical protein B0H11DRAFT_2187601 [Mycena galericulata]